MKISPMKVIKIIDKNILQNFLYNLIFSINIIYQIINYRELKSLKKLLIDVIQFGGIFAL